MATVTVTVKPTVTTPSFERGDVVQSNTTKRLMLVTNAETHSFDGVILQDNEIRVGAPIFKNPYNTYRLFHGTITLEQ